MRKGFLQEDEAKVSSKPLQLEGVSGHRPEGGDKEADLAVKLVKQSVWSVETVTEEWFSGKFYEANIKYHLFLGQPWLHDCVSPIGHRTCFLQDPSASDPSELYYLHPYTPRVFSTSKSKISYKFGKMGRRGQGIKSNSPKERWNH